jgi:hypothetical protein
LKGDFKKRADAHWRKVELLDVVNASVLEISAVSDDVSAVMKVEDPKVINSYRKFS